MGAPGRCIGTLSPSERVLDVACGTGVVARLAAARVGGSGNVVGLDLNPGMLAVAASIAPETPATSAPITWREASATKMPFTDASFDIVYCQLGLQFFPDRSAALREMHRVLVSEGRLGLMVWRGIEHSPGFRVLADALGRHVRPRGRCHDASAIQPFRLGRTARAYRCCRFPRYRDPAGHGNRSLPISRPACARLCRRLAASGLRGKGNRRSAHGPGQRGE